MRKLEKVAKQVSDWNAKYPVGTKVIRYSLIKPLRDPYPTETRSEAWVMGEHSAMIMVNGCSGGVILESVKVVK